jgi:phage protein D
MTTRGRNRGRGDSLQFSTTLQVKVNGQLLDDEVVTSVVVEQDIDQPSMAQVALDNASRDHSSGTSIGDDVEILFGRKGEGEAELVFSGQVSTVEPKYSAEGESVVTLRAFDKLHQLVRGRNSRAWEEKSEKTILSDVLDPYGLSLDTDLEYDVIHAYQHNQTDYEFLMHRAKMYGAFVRLEGNSVIVKKPDHERDFRPDIVLETKDGADYELRHFSPRMNASEILSEVEVRGWDPVKKEEVVGIATPESGPHGRLGPSLGHQMAQGNKKSFSVDSPIFSKEEAEAKAQSLLYDSMMSFVTGSGVVAGRSALSAGQVVEVKLYNKDGTFDANYRFNGRYLLSGVTHRYTREKSGNLGGYQSLVRFKRDATQS